MALYLEGCFGKYAPLFRILLSGDNTLFSSQASYLPQNQIIIRVGRARHEVLHTVGILGGQVANPSKKGKARNPVETAGGTNGNQVGGMDLGATRNNKQKHQPADTPQPLCRTAGSGAPSAHAAPLRAFAAPPARPIDATTPTDMTAGPL